MPDKARMTGPGHKAQAEEQVGEGLKTFTLPFDAAETTIGGVLVRIEGKAGEDLTTKDPAEIALLEQWGLKAQKEV